MKKLLCTTAALAALTLSIPAQASTFDGPYLGVQLDKGLATSSWSVRWASSEVKQFSLMSHCSCGTSCSAWMLPFALKSTGLSPCTGLFFSRCRKTPNARIWAISLRGSGVLWSYSVSMFWNYRIIGGLKTRHKYSRYTLNYPVATVWWTFFDVSVGNRIKNHQNKKSNKAVDLKLCTFGRKVHSPVRGMAPWERKRAALTPEKGSPCTQLCRKNPASLRGKALWHPY